MLRRDGRFESGGCSYSLTQEFLICPKMFGGRPSFFERFPTVTIPQFYGSNVFSNYHKNRKSPAFIESLYQCLWPCCFLVQVQNDLGVFESVFRENPRVIGIVGAPHYPFVTREWRKMGPTVLSFFVCKYFSDCIIFLWNIRYPLFRSHGDACIYTKTTYR